MRIDKKDIEIALKKTKKTADEMNIVFGQEHIDKFKTQIKVLKSNLKDEGSLFEKFNFSLLKAAYKRVITDSVVAEFKANKNQVYKNSVNIGEYVAAASDYMFALLQNELDCIEIPKDKLMTFKPELLDVANSLFQTKMDTLAPFDTFSRAQRRKNADTMRPEITKMIDHIKNNDPIDPEQLGKLYGEFYALKKRQENHGDVWRFFHSRENEKREALLAAMQEVLEERIPFNTVMNFTQSPSEVAKYGEMLNLSKPFDAYLEKLEANPKEALGYDNYVDEPEVKEEEKALEKPEVVNTAKKDLPSMKDCIKFLKVTYRPDLNNLAEEKEMIKQLRSALSKNQIFAEDTPNNKAIRELVFRNYMRLNTAESMANREDEWKLYCANDDMEFMNDHPYYTMPKEIPDISEEKNEIDFKEQIKKDTAEVSKSTTEKIEEPLVISDRNKSLS